jgi:ABC-type molybdenum transport system ATPase subunit/photorepair protein PhrA
MPGNNPAGGISGVSCGEDAEDGELVLDFAAEQADECVGRWLQSRYYADEGESVRDFLSYDSVFEICPFEVGVNRRSERRLHRAALADLIRLLELDKLMPLMFGSLSNGEMRRVLFARSVLKRPRKLTLVSPMTGLDPSRRALFASAIEAIRSRGVEIDIVGEAPFDSGTDDFLLPPVTGGSASRCAEGRVVIMMNGVTIRFGRRTVLKNLFWEVREGERWLLRGPNGSGKTTLLALITGDSPLAYAHDIRVFGVPRETGRELSSVRRRISVVSPEMQAYLGKSPEELVDDAFAREPELLLLDEPCCNLGVSAARKLLGKIERWLKKHPHVTTVCVAHRACEVPSGFGRVLDLGALNR